MAERSKARVCGRSLAVIAGSNPAEGMDVSVVCSRQICVTRTEDYKDTQRTKMTGKKKTQKQKQKNPAGDMDVCLF